MRNRWHATQQARHDNAAEYWLQAGDGRVIEARRTLTAEHYGAEPVPGWSSVRSSIVHIAVATEGWSSGFERELDQVVLNEEELSTLDAAERLLSVTFNLPFSILSSSS